MPGVSVPRRSAPSIIARAIRSLYEPVGLKDSSLTNTLALPGGTTFVRRTTGVWPMAWRTESAAAGTDMALGPFCRRLTADREWLMAHLRSMVVVSHQPSAISHQQCRISYHLTHSACSVVGLPHRSNQSIPSLTRSNFRA